MRDEKEREVERIENKRYSHIDVDQNQNKTQHEPWQNYKSLKNGASPNQKRITRQANKLYLVHTYNYLNQVWNILSGKLILKK